MAEPPAFNRFQRKGPGSARLRAALPLLALALLLAACGRKGPLYLPEPAPAVKIEEAAPESPES